MKTLERASDALGVVLLVTVVLGLAVGVPELRSQYGDTVTTAAGRHVATDTYNVVLALVGGALLIGLLTKSKAAVLIVFGLLAAAVWYALR